MSMMKLEGVDTNYHHCPDPKGLKQKKPLSKMPADQLESYHSLLAKSALFRLEYCQSHERTR